jgi:hypothetical protein
MAGEKGTTAKTDGGDAAATSEPEPVKEPIEYLRESSDVLFGVGLDVLDGALVDAGLASRKNLSRDEVVAAIKAYHGREVVAGKG